MTTLPCEAQVPPATDLLTAGFNRDRGRVGSVVFISVRKGFPHLCERETGPLFARASALARRAQAQD
jgi:hypothetical protein